MSTPEMSAYNGTKASYISVTRHGSPVAPGVAVVYSRYGKKANGYMEGPRLMDRVRGKLRAGHYSHLTEKAYVAWIRRFILFHGKQHPLTLGPAHVEAFLTHLAVQRKVSGQTQTQALNAAAVSVSSRAGSRAAVAPQRSPRETLRTPTGGSYAGRSRGGSCKHARRALAHRRALVRLRSALDGMYATAREGRRPRRASAHRAQRKRRQGPRYSARGSS